MNVKRHRLEKSLPLMVVIALKKVFLLVTQTDISNTFLFYEVL